ncbi:unnamed protein product [Ceutorhynchus assimilis]|uniref:Uncharacterized protein n=1 Tax=Ceutorhynchus assimilis TaxID=467358 RepID=A0A9N9MCP7_9CUCU|nr:unnamed protein product [Ceutorhynchus assimilis]
MYILGVKAEDVIVQFVPLPKTYIATVQTFEYYFIPWRNLIFERYKFNSRVQQPEPEKTQETPIKNKKEKKNSRKYKRKKKDSSSSNEEIDEIDLLESESDYEVLGKSKSPSPFPEVQNVEDTLELGNMGDYEIGESSTHHQQQPNGTSETTADIAAKQENFMVNDFVITKFKTNKRDRFYISKVEELLESSVIISSLRMKEVTKEQIVQKVKLRDIQRGRDFFTLPEGFDLE